MENYVERREILKLSAANTSAAAIQAQAKTSPIRV
jgi:hypothetical protein